jgi:tRNA nucleotidyltransferase/poly(A) polymerase
MKSLFGQYLKLREENEGPKTPQVTSRIKLQKTNGSKEFGPFTVNRTMHPNLRLLIKAFADSDKVGVGYTTIEKNKGEVEPQLKRKQLWLTGGAVRDHLKGKTPNNYDIVTDATPSEIRMILSQPEAGFTEVKPRTGNYASDERYAKLSGAGSKNKIFYASRWDKTGKELEMTAEINGEKFELSTLGKHCKSRNVEPDKAEPASSVEEDANTRDFTINAMYIPLNSADGDNSELVDPHGGAHHLKNSEVVPIGDFNKTLETDPATSLRYMKMINRYGKPDQVPEKHQQVLARHKDMTNVPKDKIRKEFLDGLEHPDVDPRKYMKSYKSAGLLGTIFPGVDFDENDMPEDFQGDRWLATAWLLKDNDIDTIKKMLAGGGWSKQEANDIAYLVKIYQWGSKNKFDAEQFYDMKQMHTGLTKSKVREWMQMVKTHGPEVDSFLSHDDKDLSPYIHGEGGKKTVNPEYTKHLGRPPQGGEFEHVKRYLSTKRWKDTMGKMKKPEMKEK